MKKVIEREDAENGEFTEDEKRLLAAWDTTNAPSPADDVQFEAGLRAALGDRLSEPCPVRAAQSARMTELFDELACAEMAADARADHAAELAASAPIFVEHAAWWRLDAGAVGPARMRAAVRPSPRKLVVLVVAANPAKTSSLRLSQECAAIAQEVKKVPQCADFHFESRWAVNLHELTGHLADLGPTVLHIAGHARSCRGGLVLQDAQGHARPVPANALTRMISAARSLRVAVLNACFKRKQAVCLRRKVDCVVGISGAIDDATARKFACEFYAALGSKRSIGNAFDAGVAALAATRPSEVQPHCLPRNGVDLHTLHLRDPSG